MRHISFMLLLLISLAGCGTQDNREPTATADQFLGKTYRETIVRYTFNYPAGWSVVSDQPRTTTLFSYPVPEHPKESLAGETLIRFVALSPGSTDFDTHNRGIIQQHVATGGEVLQRSDWLRADGTYAVRYQLRDDDETFRLYITTLRDRVLEIYAYGDMTHADDIIETLQYG